MYMYVYSVVLLQPAKGVTYFDTVLLLIEQMYSPDVLEHWVHTVINNVVCDNRWEVWSLPIACIR